ncbi:hypothetical protein KA107_00290 [Candidatus Pacearchaeota archaeon]|nr:hypothetical protein [Candidatus Pacearchaeota archaeon]
MALDKLEGLIKKRGTKICLLVFSLIFIFILVYLPHVKYAFPLHIDEWHHIDQAIKLTHGEYGGGSFAFRFGFHVILAGISLIFNLVDIYSFLPALWATLTALTLFWIVKKKTNNFYIALFSIIFFASIKSNVNILGPWFFTPLTFTLPFIFLFVYFFTEWLNDDNKRKLYASICLGVFLVFVYAIAFLFTLYFLIPYLLIRTDLLKKHWKKLLYFSIIFVVGVILYGHFTGRAFLNSAEFLFKEALIFKKGWGILELKNSFYELYSLTGYILAALGAMFLILEKKTKSYLPYLIWPLALLGAIYFFRTFDYSYLVPYQRNLYFFIISLPFLSAYGLFSLLKYSYDIISSKDRNIIKYIYVLIAILLIVFCFYNTFKDYTTINQQISIYHPISEDFYNSLVFLRNQPAGLVLAEPLPSIATYPISGQNPYTSLVFGGPEANSALKNLISLNNCSAKENFLKERKIVYIVTEKNIQCSFDKIYSSHNMATYRV